MKADERDSMMVMGANAPALGGEERRAEAPRAGAPPARRGPAPEVIAQPPRRRFPAEYRRRLAGRTRARADGCYAARGSTVRLGRRGARLVAKVRCRA